MKRKVGIMGGTLHPIRKKEKLNCRKGIETTPKGVTGITVSWE